MKKLGKNKGITLIALVITIIVMLILVVVTINIAANGGLFDTARDAASKTTWEAEEEEILNYMYGDQEIYNARTGTLSLEALRDKLKDKWNDIQLSDGKLTLRKTENGLEHIISEDGTTKTYEEIINENTDADEPTRKPFTNYIERGEYYYVYGDSSSNDYMVTTFSENNLECTTYKIKDGVIVETYVSKFKVIEKDEITYSDEVISAATGHNKDELCDQQLQWGENYIYIFIENYNKVLVENYWCILEEGYSLPNT